MRRLLLIVAVVAGCGILEPDDMCACPPGLLTTPISGEVVDASGGPLVGVRVVTESAYDTQAPTATCDTPGQTLVGTEGVPSADGQFATHVRWPGADACARVYAYIRNGAQTSTSDTVILLLDPLLPSTPREGIVLTFGGGTPP